MNLKDTIDLNGLSKVEKELNINLPKFFWDFYRHESALILKLKEVSEDADYIHITTDFDWMIKHNRDLLKLPNPDGICRNKICIGTDGCGNDSFISLLGDDERVFFIDHEIAGDLIDYTINDFRWEDNNLEKYASLQAYVENCIAIYNEL